MPLGVPRPAILVRVTRPSRSEAASKAIVVAGTALLAGTVLWTRQASDAELRVQSFGAAIGEVLFWAAPTLLLLVLTIRPPRTTFAVGVVIAGLLTWTWWISARDWHSTAALGPGLAGWFLGPLIVVGAALVVRRRRRRP